MNQSAPPPERQWRRSIMLSGVLALVIAAGGWAVFGRGGAPEDRLRESSSRRPRQSCLEPMIKATAMMIIAVALVLGAGQAGLTPGSESCPVSR